jgi:DNA-binding MarR family transcriptional regulator
MDTARYVEKIATLFGKIVARMQLDAEEEGAGLTPSQVQGLAYLFHHGETSVGDIAQGLCISHPAAVKLVDRLRKKDLASRVESASDRRVSLVTLTDSGRQVAGRILAKRTETLSRALSRMDTAQLEDVMRGLETLLAATLEDRASVESACLRCGDDHFGCCIVNRTHLELTGITMERT